MNRKYDTKLFREALDRLRAAFPVCGLTTDLIVGFPGETDEEFDDTLSFISECEFSAMHIFPFSARKGTAAYNLPDQIEKHIKQDRAKAAAAIATGMKQRYLAAQVGQIAEVLFETVKDGVSHGHAANYCEVSVPGVFAHGEIRDVRIIGVEGELLVGTITE
jgi:threonylcarbamoyladenosine tRNA methylthiotransferase MtaB